MLLRKRSSRNTKVVPALHCKEDELGVHTEESGDILREGGFATDEELRKFQEELRENSAGSTTLRERLEYALATSRGGMTLYAANAVLTITACVVYVAETYAWPSQSYTWSLEGQELGMFVRFDLCLSVIFAVDYLLHLFVAHKRSAFVFGAQGLVELATSLPGFISMYLLLKKRYKPTFPADEVTSITAVSLLRVLRVFRLVRTSRLLAFVESEILRQVYAMTLSVIYLIFFASGVLHLVENTKSLWQETRNEMESKTFFDIIYLIVTTITTVGYGDVVPETMLGRAVIMGMMCTTLVLVPRQTNKLVALLAMTSVYARQSYNRKSQSSHIVVSGDVNGRAILDFFREFFHPDHGNTNQGAVIIGEGLPSPEIRSLLSDPRFAYMVTYLDGTVMLDRDLSRAALEDAEGIFLLTNKYSPSPQRDDASCILRALSVHRYLQKQTTSAEDADEARGQNKDHGPAVLSQAISQQRRRKKPVLCIQLLQSESRRLFESSRRQIGRNDLCQNQLVCIDEIKNNIMAKSCLVPGLTTMINNLVASSEEPTLSDNEAPWLHEYAEGVGYEMYRIELSEYLQGLPFSSMAEEVYLATGVLVFALELAHVRAGSYVALNPGRFVIPRAMPELAIFAIVLAGDLDEALVVSASDKVTEEIRDKVFQNITRQESGAPSPAGAGPAPTPSKQERPRASAHFPKLFGFSRSSSGGAIMSGIDVSHADSSLLDSSRFAGSPGGDRRSTASSQRWDDNSTHRKSKVRTDAMHRHFHALDEPVPLSERHISSVDASCGPEFSSHIVVFGDVTQLYNFVLPLRRKKLGAIVPILIVHSRVPSEQDWQAVSRFEDIYFMQGSPLDMYDLNRAALRRASRAVLFAKVSELGHLSSEALVDADSVFAYSIITKEWPELQINIELSAQTNISYLADENKLRACGIKASDRYMYVPPFASGQIYTSSVLDTLSGQSYYNHKLIDILHQLVVGQNREDALLWHQETGHLVQSSIHSSELHMIPVPAQMRSRTYGDLVCFLNRMEIIPLALRRGVREERKNTMPYVVTNPPRDMELHAVDRVFVLSREPPQDRVSQCNVLGLFEGEQDEGSVADLLLAQGPPDEARPSDATKSPSRGELARPSLDESVSSAANKDVVGPSVEEDADEESEVALKSALDALQSEVRSELTALSQEFRALMRDMKSAPGKEVAGDEAGL